MQEWVIRYFFLRRCLPVSLCQQYQIPGEDAWWNTVHAIHNTFIIEQWPATSAHESRRTHFDSIELVIFCRETGYHAFDREPLRMHNAFIDHSISSVCSIVPEIIGIQEKGSQACKGNFSGFDTNCLCESYKTFVVRVIIIIEFYNSQVEVGCRMLVKPLMVSIQSIIKIILHLHEAIGIVPVFKLQAFGLRFYKFSISGQQLSFFWTERTGCWYCLNSWAVLPHALQVTAQTVFIHKNSVAEPGVTCLPP